MQSLTKYIVPVSLFAVGLIHLLPLQGILGAERLSALYGVALDDPNLLTLMRHRALLFGLLGGFLVWASFRPLLHLPALIAGFASVAGFLAIAVQSGERNEQIARVFVVDIFALVLLVVAFATYLLTRAERRTGAPY